MLLLPPSISGSISISWLEPVKGSSDVQLAFPYGFLFCSLTFPKPPSTSEEEFTVCKSQRASPLSAATSQAFHPGHLSVCCTNSLACPHWSLCLVACCIPSTWRNKLINLKYHLCLKELAVSKSFPQKLRALPAFGKLPAVRCQCLQLASLLASPHQA